MKSKILVIFLALVISAVTTKPKQALAVAAGDPCCSADRTPMGQLCVHNTVIGACNSFGGAICSIVNALPGLPDTCDAADVSASCLNVATASDLASQTVADACRNIKDNPKVPLIFKIPVFDACLGLFLVVKAVAIANPAATTACGIGPFDCDVATNQCVPKSSGPTIEPYNPECAGGTGIKTALGCVPTDAEEFAKIAIPWSIYLGAGIAFLLGLYGALLIITSSGDPEKVQAGKELITSVVIGVVVIIFAVTILTSIGVDVLGIFGF